MAEENNISKSPQSQEVESFDLESQASELKSSISVFRDAARNSTDKFKNYAKDLFSNLKQMNEGEEDLKETINQSVEIQRQSNQEFNQINSLLKSQIDVQRQTNEILRNLNNNIKNKQFLSFGNINRGVGLGGLFGAGALGGAAAFSGLTNLFGGQETSSPTSGSTQVGGTAVSSNQYNYKDIAIPTEPGQFGVTSSSRDELTLGRQPGRRDVSLDFNAVAGGKATGGLIVIPDDATKEEILAAQQYVKGYQQLMASQGYEDYKLRGNGQYGPGIKTTSENKRGKAGIFHTEPFFASDQRAVDIMTSEEGQKAYANLLASTLGRIEGVRFIAPHTTASQGAVTNVRGKQYSERNFAREFIIPELSAIAEQRKLLATEQQVEDPQNRFYDRINQNQSVEADKRKRPISQRLGNVLQYAAQKTGVEVDIYSGGQRGINESGPGRREGSTRHDHGNAADLRLAVGSGENRRILNAEIAEDRKIIEDFIRYSASAGATGIGFGKGYMDSGGTGPMSNMHIGFGSEVAWGEGNSSSTVDPGAKRAFRQGRQNQVDPVQELRKMQQQHVSRQVDRRRSAVGATESTTQQEKGTGSHKLVISESSWGEKNKNQELINYIENAKKKFGPGNVIAVGWPYGDGSFEKIMTSHGIPVETHSSLGVRMGKDNTHLSERDYAKAMQAIRAKYGEGTYNISGASNGEGLLRNDPDAVGVATGEAGRKYSTANRNMQNLNIPKPTTQEMQNQAPPGAPVFNAPGSAGGMMPQGGTGQTGGAGAGGGGIAGVPFSVPGAGASPAPSAPSSKAPAAPAPRNKNKKSKKSIREIRGEIDSYTGKGFYEQYEEESSLTDRQRETIDGIKYPKDYMRNPTTGT